jgi:hypothetical protein
MAVENSELAFTLALLACTSTVSGSACWQLSRFLLSAQPPVGYPYMCRLLLLACTLVLVPVPPYQLARSCVCGDAALVVGSGTPHMFTVHSFRHTPGESACSWQWALAAVPHIHPTSLHAFLQSVHPCILLAGVSTMAACMLCASFNCAFPNSASCLGVHRL